MSLWPPKPHIMLYFFKPKLLFIVIFIFYFSSILPSNLTRQTLSHSRYFYNGMNVIILNNVNVNVALISPTPPRHLHSLMRSDGLTIDVRIHIDIFEILKIKFLILFLCVILFLYLDPAIIYARFITFNTCTNTLYKVVNQKKLIGKKNLLVLSILTFFMIFDFHLIFLLPREFFEIKLITKKRLSLVCTCVELSKDYNAIISFCVIKCLKCLRYKYLIYSCSYPYEMLALWYIKRRSS